MHKSNDEIMKELIDSGAIELKGIDSETGEFLFGITEKMKQVNRALYDEHINGIYADTMYFWERGFVDVDDFTSTNPKISLTSKAFDAEALSKLPLEKADIFARMKEALGFLK
jgi:hypothetical protein